MATDPVVALLRLWRIHGRTREIRARMEFAHQWNDLTATLLERTPPAQWVELLRDNGEFAGYGVKMPDEPFVDRPTVIAGYYPFIPLATAMRYRGGTQITKPHRVIYGLGEFTLPRPPRRPRPL